MLNIEKEREAFSNWHESEYGEHVTWWDDVPASHIHNDRWSGWKACALCAAEKLEGCVVVPKDQIETWWQDAEEPENFATTIESIPALGENLGDNEIMEIDEHHTIHLPSKRIYGTWFEKDGERYFVTGTLKGCRSMVEAARGGND